MSKSDFLTAHEALLRVVLGTRASKKASSEMMFEYFMYCQQYCALARVKLNVLYVMTHDVFMPLKGGPICRESP